MVASDPAIMPSVTIGSQTYTNTQLEGDQPSEVLPNGNVLVGNIFDNGTEIYDPSTNRWSPGATKVHNDQSNEESWVKLANGDILTYDLWSSIADGHGEAELYEPPSSGNPNGLWVDASGGVLRFLSTNSTGNELGPALIGVRGGEPLFTGANGRTEFFNPNTKTWSKGPQLPTALVPGPEHTMVETQLTAGNAPAAALPNGDTLMALSPQVTVDGSGNESFPAPTFLYEYNPDGNIFTNVTPSIGVSDQFHINSYNDSMLVLPSGQILLTNGSTQAAFYNLAPGNGADPSWAQTITSLTQNSNGTYTLTGTQLNGRDGERGLW